MGSVFNKSPETQGIGPYACGGKNPVRGIDHLFSNFLDFKFGIHLRIFNGIKFCIHNFSFTINHSLVSAFSIL